MYDHSLNRERKHFCRYCLNAFITEEILKRHIKNCFKNNDKQMIHMPTKGEYVKFKIFEKKIWFMVYVDFESILVAEDNILTIFILTNIYLIIITNVKNMLLAIMVINQYVL